MEARVRYRRISDEDKERLIDAFEGHQTDYLELANALGIKRKNCFRSIVATHLQSRRHHKLPREGMNHTKLDEDKQTSIRHIILSTENGYNKGGIEGTIALWPYKMLHLL